MVNEDRLKQWCHVPGDRKDYRKLARQYGEDRAKAVIEERIKRREAKKGEKHGQ